MEVTIARHCVAHGKDGLSPLQQALIGDERRIRVAEAPTGAGKSFAFLRAVAQGQRVLFFVPTRRLARNLAASMVHELERLDGWDRGRAERAVAFWSSEQREEFGRDGVGTISGVRLRQMAALDPLGEGELIVAVPETVALLLASRRLEPDQSSKGVFDFLDAFDHIVFDEFHSIQARGFGLAGMFARLVAVTSREGHPFGRAKVSFLSATPLDLKPVFDALEIPETAVAWMQETLTTEGRPLHGDVTLSWSNAGDMLSLLEEESDEVLRELEAGRQVVLIYDALGDLERDLARLAQQVRCWGIDPERVLVINSIRDSAPDGTLGCGFASGRRQDPDRYDLLVATASVELGITFRDARLLLMEPGFSATNFLQRYGRCARRGADGRVVVRAAPRKVGRNPWLRTLRDWIQAHDGGTQSIEDLTACLTAEHSGAFGNLSKRAAWCTGLFWRVLMEHPSNRGGRHGHLLYAQPPPARRIHSLMQQVAELEQDREYAAHARAWLRSLKEQVLDLRGIGRQIVVVQEDGSRVKADELWLERETHVMERFPVDAALGEVRIAGYLEDHLREIQDRSRRRRWLALFPHTGVRSEIVLDEGAVETWCRLVDRIDPYGFAAQDHPGALKAARDLVRLTGLVPGDDPEISVDAQHGVL